MIRACFVLLLVFTFNVVILLPDPVEARRGGGHSFSRGAVGSFGSIRNSGRSSFSSSRMSAPTRSSYSQNRTWPQPSRPALQREKPQVDQSRLQDRDHSVAPDRREKMKDRYSDLTPEQQEGLNERIDQANKRWDGLPEEEKDKFEDRWEKREESREDRQEFREEAREDWQDWQEDLWDDYYDDYWHDHWWYHGYHHSSISFTFYVNDSPPCNTKIIHPNGYTYYQCSGGWYQSSYYQGEINYVLVSAPPGVEVTYLADYEVIRVGYQLYYLSEHTFYQQITRNGRHIYVVVDPPYGAQIKSIPKYAVKVEIDGTIYYRWDKHYYKKSSSAIGGYIVVRPPS